VSKAHAATQSDVARAAGVSRSLVSLALSGSPKVAAGTRERIEEVAASLGYRVNVSASSLARKRSTIIGLVLPNLRNAFFEQIAACLGRAAARRGLTLFVTVGSDQSEVLHQAVESLLGVRVAGIIFVSPWLPGEDLVAIGEEVPVCVIGRRRPGGRGFLGLVGGGRGSPGIKGSGARGGPGARETKELGNGQGIRILVVAPYGYLEASFRVIETAAIPQANDSVIAVAEVLQTSPGANHRVIPPVVRAEMTLLIGSESA